MGEHDQAGGKSSDDGHGNLARAAAAGRLRDLIADPGLACTAGSRRGVVPRSVDDEPASLVYDSEHDTGLRAVGSARQLRFEAQGRLLEVEVAANGQLAGWIVPPGPALVELRHRRGMRRLAADGLGSFCVPVVPDGPVSFRCSPEGAGEASFATSWVRL